MDLTTLIGNFLQSIFGGGNQLQIPPGAGVVDPHNQIVATQNRYSQFGIPNSTMLTQDIGGAMNAAQQATFGNQLQLMQLALQQQAQQNQLDLANAGPAGSVAGRGAAQQSGVFDTPTTTSGSPGAGDGVPSSGTLPGPGVTG